MKNILVPTDFSATAQNAARYALLLAEQLGSPKIILYHAYQAPLMLDPMVPAVSLLDEEQLKKSSQESLDKHKLTLLAFCPKCCVVDTYSEYALLNNGLDDACAETGSGWIVMGITGGGMLEEKLIGSNTVDVAKHSKVPVIIVPHKAGFAAIKKIMLLSDFDKVDQTIPVTVVRKIVEQTKATLLVFNQEEESDDVPSKIVGESYAVHTLLQDLNPEFHFSHNENYIEAVNSCALENMVDLIITIPKKHGFFESLFTTSHTTQLAFHTHVPLMVVHA